MDLLQVDNNRVTYLLTFLLWSITVDVAELLDYYLWVCLHLIALHKSFDLF